MDGKTELQDYLISFEKYFEKKFDGDEYDQSQKLGKFLKGELLQVYSVQGGSKLQYSQMKKPLLKWYCKQKIGGRTFWQKELEGARIEEEEPLDLYGVWLMSMAELVYSDLKIECGRQFGRNF